MQNHEWRVTTPEGEKRYNRATFHAGRWIFETTLKTDPEWYPVESPDRDFLEALLDIVERKYQRKRLPHEHVLWVQSMIDELPQSLESLPESPE